MEKIKCSYPGCKKEQERKFNFKLINETDASINLGFCKYHFYIVIGGHFKAKIHRNKDLDTGEEYNPSFELIGPLKEVEFIEQVIGARELIKLESDKKK